MLDATLWENAVSVTGKMFPLSFLENANNLLYSRRVTRNLIVSCDYTDKVADGYPQRSKKLEKIFHNLLLSSTIGFIKELREIILPWLSKTSRDIFKNNFKKYLRIPITDLTLIHYFSCKLARQFSILLLKLLESCHIISLFGLYAHLKGFSFH